jgi:hypothetical protein
MCVAEVLPGILPTIGLKIFLALMPLVLRFTSQFVAGLHSESAVDFDVGRKFFIFQFVVVFLLVTVIGAMSSGKSASAEDRNSKLPVVMLAEALIDDPAQIPTWLGTAIPQQVSEHCTPGIHSPASEHCTPATCSPASAVPAGGPAPAAGSSGCRC